MRRRFEIGAAPWRAGWRLAAAAAVLGVLAALGARAGEPPVAAPVRGAIVGTTPGSAAGRALPAATAAASDTDWSGVQLPEPSATYGSFAAARDAARHLVDAVLGRWAEGPRWSADSVSFMYIDRLEIIRPRRGGTFATFTMRDAEVNVPGLSLHWSCEDADCPGHAELDSTFAAAGWVRNDRYDADGADGTNFALECREALLHVDAQWDGGDDADSTAVAKPGITLNLRVVPRPPRDPRIPAKKQ